MISLAVLLATVGVAPVPAAAADQIPVVFVHGRNAGPGVWGGMRSDFESAGYPAGLLFAWSYDSTQSTNEVLTHQLSSYVDDVLQQTGAARVDLVAHSLGSLPTRWYVKFGGGQNKVRSWVSLGGPNHGTGLAWWCALWDQGCKDMTPNSYVLSNLNSGDETPGATRYATIWSDCDNEIDPTSSTALGGALNMQTTCLEHNDLLGASVLVRTFLLESASRPVVGLAGKCLDVDGGATTDGTRVQLWGCNGTGAQLWTRAGATLRALGKCLDVAADGRTRLWTCNGTPTQQWSAGANSSLVNAASGKCLDISGDSSSDGAQAIVWTCHGGANQRWS